MTNFTTNYLRMLNFVTTDAPVGYGANEMMSVPVVLPECLKHVYTLAGKSKVNLDHNRLLAPNDLRLEDYSIVCFASENQEVVVWGFKIDTSNEDLMVYQRLVGETDADGEWFSEKQRLSEFLISFGYWNAANGCADFCIVGQLKSAPDDLLPQMTKVWETPDFVVRELNRSLLIITDSLEFYAFGTTQDSVTNLVGLLDVVWQYTDPEVDAEK